MAILAVYANSFSGPFIFDDGRAIPDNPTIRQLWPLGHCTTPCTWSPALNQQVHTRPLLNLSFALNYMLGGVEVWGYHALNVAIHVANALLLFGILRRTLVLPALRDKFGDAAVGLSLAIALLWAVHPLQTESVTYIVQRAESLVALFYFLTLYCVIRGAVAGRPAGWYAGSVFACILGMSTKEVMVTAPFVVFLFDGIFLAGSFRQALVRRPWLYAGLALAWALLAYLVLLAGELGNLYTGYEGRGQGVGAWSYAATQAGVVLHYLRLSLWPWPLVLDYDWPVAKDVRDILPHAVVIGLLCAATLWSVVARNGWGFLGAWFFVILSPTSSVVPLEDLIFEHRMYLPLAAPLAGLVLAGYLCVRQLGGRGWIAPAMVKPLGLCALAAIVATLGILTHGRNKNYATALEIFQATVEHAPGSSRGRNNLGLALAALGRTEEAIVQYREAVRLKPANAEAHNNLGLALAGTGRKNEAIRHYLEALKLRPRLAEAHDNLGLLLQGIGRSEEAVSHFREAVALKPGFAEARSNLADALAVKGQTDEAVTYYQEALALKPGLIGAHNNLANVLVAKGRMEDAIWHYREALRLKPVLAEGHNNLGIALARSGQSDEAIERFREAFALKPDYAEAHNNLGIALFNKGDHAQAGEEFRAALRIKPDYAEAKRNLDRLIAEGARRP